MKPQIKQKWITALTSGEYIQGQDALYEQGKFCCLGVLCDLYVKETGAKWIENTKIGGGYGLYAPNEYDPDALQTCSLPEEVMEWADIHSIDGHLPTEIFEAGERLKSLMELNDRARFNFAQIAEVIQKQF